MQFGARELRLVSLSTSKRKHAVLLLEMAVGVRASAADTQRTLCRFYETSKPAPALRLHQHPLLGKETLSLSQLIVRTIILQSPQPRLLLLTRGFVFSTTPLLRCVSCRLDSHTEIISKVMSGSDAFMWNDSKRSATNHRWRSVNEWFE